ncbi:MAG: RNA methyltransferase, partial [Patescibacteria group bacterium]|nr:RNA methyltransferase [Patescibacteria group bacterium]
SALAFDLENIIIDEKCADVYNSKTIGAAKDAIFKLNIVSDKSLKIFDQIKNKMKVFSTSLENSDTLDVLKNEKPFCLILGNESHGIDEELQEMSDARIKIEMGKKIESLNVASASAIVFYELYKMRK